MKKWETLLLDAIDWFGDALFFTHVSLRDHDQHFRTATFWVRFHDVFAPMYRGVLDTRPTASTREAERDMVSRLALDVVIPPEWLVAEVHVDPNNDEDTKTSVPPRDAIVHVWLQSPSKTMIQDRASRRAHDRELRPGRRGYVVREAGFQGKTWGAWVPRPESVDLMAYVRRLPPMAFSSGEAFAATLNAEGFSSLEGKPFTRSSVQRVAIARELVLGNEKPNP